MDGYNPYAYSMSVVPPLATPFMPSAPIQRTVPLSETSLSKSSKLSDWIKKGPTPSNKNQNSDTISLVEPQDPSDSMLPYSPKASSEVTHDESD